MSTEDPICERCGQHRDRHMIFNDLPDYTCLPPEALIPGERWRGLYCPEPVNG